MQQVGQTHLPLLDLRGDGILGLLGPRQFDREAFAFGDERGGVLPLTLGHSNSLGIGIALGAQPIDFDLYWLALVFERAQCLHIERDATSRHVAGDGLGI